MKEINCNHCSYYYLFVKRIHKNENSAAEFIFYCKLADINHIKEDPYSTTKEQTILQEKSGVCSVRDTSIRDTGIVI